LDNRRANLECLAAREHNRKRKTPPVKTRACQLNRSNGKWIATVQFGLGRSYDNREDALAALAEVEAKIVAMFFPE
jgi:hypothetical protein